MSNNDYVKVIRVHREPVNTGFGGIGIAFIGLLFLGALAGLGHAPPASPRGPAMSVAIPPPPVPQAVRCFQERGPGWCWGVFAPARGYVPNPAARRCIRHPDEAIGWCWAVYRPDT